MENLSFMITAYCPYCKEKVRLCTKFSGPTTITAMDKDEDMSYIYMKAFCPKCKRTWSVKLFMKDKED